MLEGRTDSGSPEAVVRLCIGETVIVTESDQIYLNWENERKGQIHTGGEDFDSSSCYERAKTCKGTL